MLIDYAKNRPEVFNVKHLQDDGRKCWRELLNSRKKDFSSLGMVGNIISSVLASPPKGNNNSNNSKSPQSKKLNILDYIINKQKAQEIVKTEGQNKKDEAAKDFLDKGLKIEKKYKPPAKSMMFQHAKLIPLH